VERFVLGCGNFGGIGSAPAFFGQGESEGEAHALLDAAWELGIRRLDTADAYGGGRSEAWIGSWLRARGPEVRDAARITTKTFNPMDEGHDRGLAPERVRRQLHSSLERLGVERVALYLAHEMDPETPLEETAETLEDLVAEGLVEAWGGSNVDADWVRDAPWCSAVQNSYSLLERGDARELLPLCADRGVGYQAFSPLAGGWLTGKYRRGEAPPEGSRMTLRPEPYAHLRAEGVFDALEAFEARAHELGVSPAGLDLAWVVVE
jgi:aryl-alcohol dehydrogenase-like predicted oxidoreductase